MTEMEQPKVETEQPKVETDEQSKTIELKIPEEFSKVINDMINDITVTFPEYIGIISKWWSADNKTEQVKIVFMHCVRVYPERFFDILYKNVDMFSPKSEINTEFLPGIVFKHLWNCEGVSDTTKDVIWKYLQLVLFSVIGSVHNTADFGDAAKLFEAINEDELKNKLQETIDSMANIFDNNDFMNTNTTSEQSQSDSKEPPIDLPDAEQLHEHLNSMLGGKLGKLAMELAEETSKEMNLDMSNTTDAKGVFEKLFKNPGKLMNMVKNIGTKIDEKIKSGELKESEIISEGMDLLNKMKTMPGMGNIEQMFAQMGMPGMGKAGKMNMGAMESHLNQNLKMAKMKERMKTKVDAKQTGNAKQTQNVTANQSANSAPISEEEIIRVFSSGEKVERTPRGAKTQIQTPVAYVDKPNKKKKGKK